MWILGFSVGFTPTKTARGFDREEMMLAPAILLISLVNARLDKFRFICAKRLLTEP
jgi:hypothetical protein